MLSCSGTFLVKSDLSPFKALQPMSKSQEYFHECPSGSLVLLELGAHLCHVHALLIITPKSVGFNIR